jgi:DNA-binding MarR family transcriptional regulator
MHHRHLLRTDSAEPLTDAKTIAALLPAIMRQIFAGQSDAAFELPLMQLRVCSVLLQGPRPISAVGRELGVSLSAMTQLADRLERAELVTRVAQGDDRRVRCLQLTARGEQLMQSHEDARVRRVALVLQHLAAGQGSEILAALQTLSRACEAAAGRDGDAASHELELSTAKAQLL